MRVLLIEDDRRAAEPLLDGLRDCGYAVHHELGGRAGFRQALSGHFNLVIADRMLPGMDGLEIVRSLRERDIDVPVLVLSALGTVDDRVQGLRAGGDDYLVKPVAFEELVARIEALLRRQPRTPASTPDSTVLAIDDLELDLVGRGVQRDGHAITLTPREFRLLEFLVRRAGQAVTRAMLLEGVWDLSFDPQTSVIDVHISRLRQLVDKGHPYPLIHTVRGVGYMVRSRHAAL